MKIEGNGPGLECAGVFLTKLRHRPRKGWERRVKGRGGGPCKDWEREGKIHRERGGKRYSDSLFVTKEVMLPED